MPDVNGKFYFIDFKTELKNRGFDGFQDSELGTFVNRGYFHVARKSQWYWEETTDAFTITPGAASVDLWPAGVELPNFRTLDHLYVTTAGHTSKLQPMNKDDFFEQWLSQDLTQAAIRSEPTHYYVWSGKLYVLSPPASSRDFIAHYHRRVSAMMGDTDQPLTPIHLDEAILDAARIRAHNRALEPSLAQLARGDLEEVFDDMRDDEEEMMDEEQDRVQPDNGWL